MGSSLLYISIAYYMQKGGGWVQIACKIAYILNGRSLISPFTVNSLIFRGLESGPGCFIITYGHLSDRHNTRHKQGFLEFINLQHLLLRKETCKITISLRIYMSLTIASNEKSTLSPALYPQNLYYTMPFLACVR